jgi:4-hydroxybenzoate polyprenyltransferase
MQIISINLIKILRINQYIKHLFVIPGVILATLTKSDIELNLIVILIAFISIFLVSSANYVLNEMLDKEHDKFHPLKNKRVFVKQQYDVKTGYIIYIIFAVIGIFVSTKVNSFFTFFNTLFLISGLTYNLKPFRFKNIPIIDIINESFNLPIRLLLGWAIIAGGGEGENTYPPMSIIFFFWFSGAFLMSAKRLSEVIFFNNKFNLAKKYRPVYNFYTKDNLIFLSAFFALFSIFLITFFVVKYKIDYIILIPFVVLLFSYYFFCSLAKNEIVNRLENLYKNYFIIFIILIIFFGFVILTFIDLNIDFLKKNFIIKL